jgi:hypothetical protein
MGRRNGGDPITDPIVVACESIHLGEHTIIEGETYRASHPAVQERPETFLDWLNSTTGERRERNRELMERAGVYG